MSKESISWKYKSIFFLTSLLNYDTYMQHSIIIKYHRMQEKIRYGKIPLSQEAIKTIAQTLDIILKSNQDVALHANTFLSII